MSVATSGKGKDMRTLLALFAVALGFPLGAIAQTPSRAEIATELVRLMDGMRIPPKDKEKCSKLARVSIEKIHDSDFDRVTTITQTFTMVREGCFDPFSSFVQKKSVPKATTTNSFPTGTDAPSPTISVVAGALSPVVNNPLPSKVVYIAVGTFFTDASVLVKTAMAQYIGMHGKEPRFIILDLRDNLGGNLKEAGKLLELFSPRADEIAYTAVPRLGKTIVRKMSVRGPFAHIPIAVLINDETGSASETVAGVLKLWGAVAVGKKTYGKGVYQIKYTLGQIEVLITEGEVFLGPNRVSYHGKGIEPDHGMEVEDARITYNSSDKVYRKAVEGMYFP